ncbi:MAG: hypothetical protein K2L83_03500 [Muribaculaceae bacterium]|nr:hypothetical protein [Muribaculaceae bacterium]
MKAYYYRIAAIVAVIVAGFTTRAEAQYYQMANQLTNMLQPALSGSFNYKGFVDATATFGMGLNRANFIGVSTTQGFQYSSWFFMGVGMGVDMAMATGLENAPLTGVPPTSATYHNSDTTKVMIPVFSDFRFNIGSGMAKPSLFIDVKIGATWLIGSSYLQLANSRLTGQAQFLLRPSVGVRIPVNQKNAKQAVDIGLTYQLLTANNAWGYINSNTTTLNSLGVTASYEW